MIGSWVVVHRFVFVLNGWAVKFGLSGVNRGGPGFDDFLRWEVVY